jgi:integrase
MVGMAKALHERITVTLVKGLVKGATVWDTDVKGFVVRKRSEGKPTYAVKTRVKGRQRWMTIGKHGSPWTPEMARKEALRVLAQATSGVDVGAGRAAERQKATMKEVAERFLALHVAKLKPNTVAEYTRIINQKILPTLGTRKADDISRMDCARLHAGLTVKPRVANLTLAILSKLMNWSIEHGYRADPLNPCKRIGRFRENKRERFLQDDEMARLGAALAGAETNQTESIYAIAAIRLLVLTGARLREILTLKWSYIDLQRRFILLPDSKTGAKPIALNQAAIDILFTIPRLENNPHVIVGHVAGEALINIYKPWHRITEAAKLDGLRLHDLRHSFASFAVARGGSLPVLGKLLGHSQPSTTARYAHLSDDPVSKLAEDTGAHIAAVLGAKSCPTKVADA